jgi:protein-tyrosine phosphatase
MRPQGARRPRAGRGYRERVEGFVDVHSHVVPSGDDGAASVEEGVELCRIAFAAGTRVLFATPHAHAEWDTFPRTRGRVDIFDRAFPRVRDAVAEWGLDLRRGWEVYPSLLTDGPVDLDTFRLEGTRAVLVEFPGWWLGIDDAVELVAAAARRVEVAGLVPLLAHPERCRAVADDPTSVRPLAEAGWRLCLNGPSLTGDHGATAERIAWRLLDEGVVSLVASDAHGFGRPPRVDTAYAAVEDAVGRETAMPLFDGSAIPWVA